MISVQSSPLASSPLTARIRARCAACCLRVCVGPLARMLLLAAAADVAFGAGDAGTDGMASSLGGEASVCGGEAW